MYIEASTSSSTASASFSMTSRHACVKCSSASVLSVHYWKNLSELACVGIQKVGQATLAVTTCILCFCWFLLHQRAELVYLCQDLLR